MLENVKWLGHASIKIAGSRVIYIDPWNIGESEKADIILITHDHYDHCSIKDINRLLKENTVMVATADCAPKLSGKIKAVNPGDSVEVGGVKIEAVPAYNLDKNFHQKLRNWVGYIVDLDGVKYYHAGDSDFIPEMKKVKADVAFLPVGGTYTMDVDGAYEAVKAINPRVAVPVHYGAIVGSDKDAEEFRQLCEASGIEVRILEKEQGG